MLNTPDNLFGENVLGMNSLAEVNETVDFTDFPFSFVGGRLRGGVQFLKYSGIQGDMNVEVHFAGNDSAVKIFNNCFVNKVPKTAFSTCRQFETFFIKDGQDDTYLIFGNVFYKVPCDDIGDILSRKTKASELGSCMQISYENQEGQQKYICVDMRDGICIAKGNTPGEISTEYEKGRVFLTSFMRLPCIASLEEGEGSAYIALDIAETEGRMLEIRGREDGGYVVLQETDEATSNSFCIYTFDQSNDIKTTRHQDFMKSSPKRAILREGTLGGCNMTEYSNLPDAVRQGRNIVYDLIATPDGVIAWLYTPDLGSTTRFSRKGETYDVTGVLKQIFGNEINLLDMTRNGGGLFFQNPGQVGFDISEREAMFLGTEGRTSVVFEKPQKLAEQNSHVVHNLLGNLG